MSLVQILIPAFNVERFIQATLDSLVNQKFTDWEAIVLDDCSMDNTTSIVATYALSDHRITLIRNEKNLGMMPNWNLGITYCTAKYFLKLDADDMLHTDALLESVHILETHPEVGLICSKFREVDENGFHRKNQDRFPEPDFLVENIFQAADLVKKGALNMFSYGISIQGVLLIRKKVLDDAGNYLLHSWGDQELWFRLGAHTQFYFIPKELYYYRKWNDSHTSFHTYETIQKGFYETRTAIANYYYKSSKLSAIEFNKIVRETTFVYNSFLIYNARIKGNYLKMIQHLYLNCLLDPKRTCIENLHLNRLWGGK